MNLMSLRSIVIVYLAFFLIETGSGQTLPKSSQSTKGKPASSPAKKNTNPNATPAKPKGLTVESVLAMINAGLSEDLIIARIRKDEAAVDLSPDQMIQLKQAGASDSIIKVLLDPKTDLAPAKQIWFVRRICG